MCTVFINSTQVGLFMTYSHSYDYLINIISHLSLMLCVYINIIYKVYFIFKSLIFILDSIRISFEAQNWVIMKEEDKIILVLIEYLRF